MPPVDLACREEQLQVLARAIDRHAEHAGPIALPKARQAEDADLDTRGHVDADDHGQPIQMHVGCFAIWDEELPTTD